MNFRFTIILFAVLLLLVGGLLVATLWDDKPAADQVLLAPLAGMKPADIDVVEIERTEPNPEKLTFARSGKERWELRDTNAGRLDFAAVTRLIEALLKLKPTESTDLTGDPAVHGLDKPTLRITLRGSNQHTATLNVGDTTLGGDRAVTFVTTGERPNTPVAVKRSDLAVLFRDGTKDGKAGPMAKWITDYRLRRLLGVDIFDAVAQAKAIRIKAAGKELALSRVANSEWKFDAPPGYGLADIAGDPEKPDAITGVRPLVVLFTTLQATANDDFIENPEPLEKYGLAPNDPNLIRIELIPADGPPDVLLVGKTVEGSKPEKRFAQVVGERCVVKVPGDRIAALLRTVADPRPLQDRTLIKELDAPRINAVDIGTTAKLRHVFVGKQIQWVIYGGPTDPQIAGPAIQNLIAELAKPRVALEALPTLIDSAFAGPELKAEIRLWIDGLAEKSEPKGDAIPPEPKLKGGPNFTLLIGKTEGETAYLRRILADGTKTDFKVPASLAAVAAKKRIDYFDLKFKEFPTNFARRLRFNRGAELFDLARSEQGELDFPNGKWTFAKPVSLQGKTADDGMLGGTQIGAGLLGTLATLSAASVVVEKPSDAELKAMGLDPAAPRMTVTVNLDIEKDKERVYLFGNETQDKAYVHFKQPTSPIVYLVPRVGLDAFFTADLRDRTPYRIPDTKDVKSIKLTGWKKKFGKTTEIVLERDGDNWKATSTPPFAVNQQGVGTLLAFLRAPKPVAVIGAQQDAQGFDAAKGGDPLQIEFFRVNAPNVVIDLGNETDAGANYFAWNSVTNEVITLPSGLFRQFKDGPEFLKK